MGGNESRVILGHSGSTYNAPSKYLMVENYNIGTFATVGPKDTNNRLQKIRIQDTSSGAYIRFDRHPQRGLRVCGDRVELYNSSWDGSGEWVIQFIAVKNGVSWTPLNEVNSMNIDLSAKTMKKVGKIKVALMNQSNNSWLTINDKDQVVVKHMDISENRDPIEVQQEIKENELVWEMEYVTNAMSKNQVTFAVVIPVLVAGGLATAALTPLLGPAAVAAYGLPGVLAIQAVGTAGLGVAGFMTFDVVGSVLVEQVRKIFEQEMEI